MAKTLNTADVTTSSPNGTKKQRKKQAKREAKTMLKLEQARKDVEKAEQKVARAQEQLESNRTHLRNLEAELEKMHTSQHHSASGTDTTDALQDQATSSSSAMNNGNTSQEEETPAPAETETAWHPVEAGEQAVQVEENSHDDAEAEDIHVDTDQ